ncbi:MAG TPA: hypothetical protein VM345_07740 [Acidimicrobiales bacterium]|nr:hypothetical protein [Acidimicrobiales bacterium]
MYLFNRTARLGFGHARDGIEWAVTVTEKVNQITSLDAGLWVPVMSPGVNAVSWGCTLETLADMEAADAKLQADSIFNDLLEQGATKLTGTVDDEVAQFVERPAATPDATHVAVVRAQLSNGALQRGIAAGVEIAHRATAIGGLPTSFLVAVTGQYGGCGWITAGSSLKQLEEAEQAINTNADFVAFLDGEAASCYQPGVTTQSIWKRVI